MGIDGVLGAKIFLLVVYVVAIASAPRYAKYIYIFVPLLITAALYLCGVSGIVSWKIALAIGLPFGWWLGEAWNATLRYTYNNFIQSRRANRPKR